MSTEIVSISKAGGKIPMQTQVPTLVDLTPEYKPKIFWSTVLGGEAAKWLGKARAEDLTLENWLYLTKYL